MSKNLQAGPTDNMMLVALNLARINWNDWRDVYEHGEPIATNPLLTCSKRFAQFCHGYRVARTIHCGTQDELRKLLIKKLATVVSDESGRGLDNFHRAQRRRFGTCNGTKGFISALPKVAAFVRPARFVARDSYSMKGLNVVLGRHTSAPFPSYEDYLAAFDLAWGQSLGTEIKERVIQSGNARHLETQERFLRRVLDIYLMQCGGRILEFKKALKKRHKNDRASASCTNN